MEESRPDMGVDRDGDGISQLYCGRDSRLPERIVMDQLYVAMSTALWLGILTSISPCPLATNIAAVSFIGRRLDRPGLVVASGALYTLGRTIAYVGLGVLLVGGALSVPELSRFLQKYMNQILGPLLIIAGMFLLNMISFTTSGSAMGERLQKRIGTMGIWGAVPLGMLFALSFCPISAALFFGSLIPLVDRTGVGGATATGIRNRHGTAGDGAGYSAGSECTFNRRPVQSIDADREVGAIDYRGDLRGGGDVSQFGVHFPNHFFLKTFDRADFIAIFRHITNYE